MSEKADIKQKLVQRDKESCIVLIKEQSHQETITVGCGLMSIIPATWEVEIRMIVV
jgi:hypothetical protein